MNNTVPAGIAALVATALRAGLALAQSNQGVASLRGTAVDEPNSVAQVHRQMEGRMVRDCRQQPPGNAVRPPCR